MGNNNRAGMGGVVRDHCGNLVMAFSVPVRVPITTMLKPWLQDMGWGVVHKQHHQS